MVELYDLYNPDFAAEAGVDKGAIYEYFCNKNEMSLAFIDIYLNLAKLIEITCKSKL